MGNRNNVVLKLIFWQQKLGDLDESHESDHSNTRRGSYMGSVSRFIG